MKHLVILAAALLLPTSSLIAQSAGQTPENAQRFVAMTLPTTISNYHAPSNWRILMHRTSTAASASEDCQTTFSARVDQGSGLSDPQPITLDWRATLEVIHQAGSSDVSLVQANDWKIMIGYGSANIAARAAFAMEFLRQHCDPTAGTGF